MRPIWPGKLALQEFSSSVKVGVRSKADAGKLHSCFGFVFLPRILKLVLNAILQLLNTAKYYWFIVVDTAKYSRLLTLRIFPTFRMLKPTQLEYSRNSTENRS